MARPTIVEAEPNPRASNGPDFSKAPTVKLRLKYDLIPQNAPAIAELAVSAAKQVDGVRLDYSPESIDSVDAILRKMREQRLTFRDVGEIVFSFGCYVGEVLVRNHGCEWKLPSDTIIPKDQQKGIFMVIVSPDGSAHLPTEVAMKMLMDNKTDGVGTFYRRIVMRLKVAKPEPSTSPAR